MTDPEALTKTHAGGGVMANSKLYEDIPGLVYDGGHYQYRLGIRKLAADKFLVFNLLDGQSDFFNPFSTWQEAYAAALQKIWFEHAQDLLIPRVKALVRALADEHGLSYKMANELLQWPAGEEEEQQPIATSTSWLKP